MRGLTTSRRILGSFVLGFMLIARIDTAGAQQKLVSVTVDPARGPARNLAGAIALLADSPGATIILPAGTFTWVADVPPFRNLVTIRGQGKNATILDGRGGAGSGNRLAYGKGIIHARTPVVISNLGFVRGGGADRKADGEAALYFEGFTGTAQVMNCAINGGENGIFVPPGGITLKVSGTDFSLATPNGQSLDGKSHDIYFQGTKLFVETSRFGGPVAGHAIKARAPIDVSGSTIAATNGNSIDLPNGFSGTVRNSTLVKPMGSVDRNIVRWGEEGISPNSPGNAVLRISASKFDAPSGAYVVNADPKTSRILLDGGTKITGRVTNKGPGPVIGLPQ